MSGIGAISIPGLLGPGEMPFAGDVGVRDDQSFALALRAAAADGEPATSFIQNSNYHGRAGTPISRHDQLRESAKQLVASALLMPVLAQMDASPLRPKSGPFALNVVEKRFGPIAHQHTADRIMQTRSFGLVDAVVRRLAGTPESGVEVTA